MRTEFIKTLAAIAGIVILATMQDLIPAAYGAKPPFLLMFSCFAGVPTAIVAGLLTDKTGCNYWNLNTGDFKLTKGSVEIRGVKENGTPIVFTDNIGRKIEIGPHHVRLTDDNTYVEVNSGMIYTGTRTEDGGYTMNAYLHSDGDICGVGVYNNVYSSLANVCVSSNGVIRRIASSSERYKRDVTEEIKEELLEEEMLEEGIDPFADLRDQKAQIESTIANLKMAIEQNHAAMRSMYLDKVKGIISAAEYSDHVLTLSEEKSDFERQIIEFNEHIEQIETTLAIHDNKKLLASQYTGTRILSKEMFSILIDYILVGRKDPLTKETPVEIHWNF